ncbi:MAG: membrane protein insertase YidC [Dehalococcoidales bacterium]|nr:membrane protein insertase YidC [Dehalococcoidales bacterium]
MNPWDYIIQAVVNVLIVLSHFLFNNPGLAIIILTIVVNAIILPLTLKQIKSTKAMQDLQPKLAELQKKYAKDKNKLAQEQMALYKQAGMNPVGCLLPLLIQMPVWIALYQSIIKILGTTPEDFLNLSRYLYNWPISFSSIPLAQHFLWFNLGQPDPYMILPILVGAAMWIQQKMVTTSSPDPRQQQQSQMMLWMMPIIFAFFTLSFPSGLALFWLVSSIIRIIIQYFVTGWGGLRPNKAAPTKQAIVKKTR